MRRPDHAGEELRVAEERLASSSTVRVEEAVCPTQVVKTNSDLASNFVSRPPVLNQQGLDEGGSRSMSDISPPTTCVGIDLRRGARGAARASMRRDLRDKTKWQASTPTRWGRVDDEMTLAAEIDKSSSLGR